MFACLYAYLAYEVSMQLHQIQQHVMSNKRLIASRQYINHVAKSYGFVHVPLSRLTHTCCYRTPDRLRVSSHFVPLFSAVYLQSNFTVVRFQSLLLFRCKNVCAWYWLNRCDSRMCIRPGRNAWHANMCLYACMLAMVPLRKKCCSCAYDEARSRIFHAWIRTGTLQLYFLIWAFSPQMPHACSNDDREKVCTCITFMHTSTLCGALWQILWHNDMSIVCLYVCVSVWYLDAHFPVDRCSVRGDGILERVGHLFIRKFAVERAHGRKRHRCLRSIREERNNLWQKHQMKRLGMLS